MAGLAEIVLATGTGALLLTVSSVLSLKRDDIGSTVLNWQAFQSSRMSRQSQDASPTRNTVIPANRKPLDTTGWKTLFNKHGWSVRYPTSWEAETVDGDGDKPEEAFQPILRGPKGCYERGEECGFVQLGSGWHPLSGLERTAGAKGTLLEKVNDSRFILLQQGDAAVSGLSGYFIVYRMKLYEDYPNGIIFKEIGVHYRNYFYFILFREESKNRVTTSAINSPEVWRQNGVFETIASSFLFTAKSNLDAVRDNPLVAQVVPPAASIWSMRQRNHPRATSVCGSH